MSSNKLNQPDKIFNVYTQPTKWYYLKYLIFLTLLLVKKAIQLVFGSKPIDQFDALQPLSSHPKGFDAVFFQAVSQTGLYICAGIERRHQGKASTVLYVIIPGMGILESTHMPRTLVPTNPSTIMTLKKYAAAGLTFEPIIPMKRWLLTYDGKMRVVSQPDKTVDVKIRGNFTSDLPCFNFDTDMSLRAIARAMARETWSRKYFENLKNAHQTHYQQMGYFTGTLTVENREYNFVIDAFRDHSFAYKRDWSLMHRYIYHMLYLEDGTRVSIGVISQPCTSSSIDMGYIISPNNQTIHSIEKCNLLLYQHGEMKTPPTNYAFTFYANNNLYDVKINVNYEASHYKGDDDGEAKLIERFLTCQINGVDGKGIVEWHYNNLNGN